MKRILSAMLTLLLCIGMLPMQVQAAGLPFTDVPAGAWYYADVKNAYESGLINGKNPTTFAPDDNMVYAEAIKLAACMHQKYTTGSVTLQNGSPWYQSYVDYAFANNIISKEYAWNQQATRAGYMEIFAGALPAEALAPINYVQDGLIPDVPMTHVQAPAIYKLYRAGILQGNDEAHSCNPSAGIKRSEVAAILTRMMDSSKRVTFTLGEVPKELTITVQPADVTVAAGESAVFTIAVEGGEAPYSYRWEYKMGSQKWKAVAGETEATMSRPMLAAELDAGLQFRCVVTDAKGDSVTSDAAKAIKKAAPPLVITAQPQNVECKIGDTVTFTVAVSGGTEPYTYLWRYTQNGLLGYKPFSAGLDSAAGYDTATLTVQPDGATFGNNRAYRCEITDAEGKSVITEVVKATKIAAPPLEITAQPADVEGKIDTASVFTVEVKGGMEPYTYSWQYTQDGVNYADLTDAHVTNGWVLGHRSNTLTVFLSADDLEMGFGYRCIITDDLGESQVSQTGYVHYDPPIRISMQPTNKLAKVDEEVVFVVVAMGGTEPYSYQWQEYASAFSKPKWLNVGIDHNELALTATTELLDRKPEYRCIITDADGNSVTSDVVKLTKLVSKK